MSVIIHNMNMPKNCTVCPIKYYDGESDCCPFVGDNLGYSYRTDDCPLVPVPPHGRLKKRVVYRGEVYNAIEAARINALDGILADRYKDGFHDGLKRALEILADEVKDIPAIIPAEEG